MATKNLVPRATGEGQIGTSAKKWSQANFVTGSFDNLNAVNLNVGSSTISETIDDRVDALLTAGSGITLNYNDSANSLTIASTVSGGSTTLEGLSDTDITSPSSGHILVHDGTNSFDNVALSGDATLAANGTLTLSSSATPTFASLTLTQNAGLNMSNKKITSLATPTSNADAANKSYVDSVAQGLDVQPSVKLRLTGISGWSGSYTNGSTHQSVTLSTGDRIITDSSLASQSGIFIVQASGAPIRPSNFDTGHEAAGAFVFVEEGTYADKGFVCTNNSGSDVVGTHGLTFTQFTQITLTSGSGVNVDSTDIDLYTYSLTAINNETSGSAIDSGDYLIVHDMSDSSQSGNGSTRKIRWQYLKNQIINYAYSSNDLNMYNRKIYTTENNGSITLDPHGTGKVYIQGNQDSSGTNPAGIRLASENNQYSVTINSPTNSQYSSSSYNLTLPGNAGSADQVLKTDGSGNLSWVDQSGGGGGSYTSSIKNNSSATSYNAGNSTYTITDNGTNNEVYYILTPTANQTITLPAPSTSGQKINIKNMSSSYSITVSPASGHNLDSSNSNTHALTIQYENITLVADGSSDWYRV